MRKWIALVVLLLVAVGAKAQTQTTTITIVAPASLGTITPTPSHFYQNTAAPISLASSSSGFNASCTATVGTTALPVTYSSTTLALTANLTAAMTSTLGSLTITITCTPAALTMNSPVVLPNALVGQSYSASLATATGLSGGVPPYTWTVNSGSLPAGLTLSSSGVITGTPSSSGSSTFGFKVTDSSGFALFVDPFRQSAVAGLRS
jgi:hypothetical protein